MLPLDMAQNRIAAGIGDATDRAVVAAATSSVTSLRSRRVPLRDMIVTKPNPIDMVLDGLPVGSLGVVLGQGGVGKSIAMLHVAHAVAVGTDSLGCLLPEVRITNHGRVVYLAGEDDEKIVHHRIHAFGRYRPEAEIAAMDARIDIVPLVGTAPTILDGRGEINDEALGEIREAAKGTRLLIIDPLRQFHAGDENDNGMMTVLSKALTRVAHEERCAIVLVHHVSKSGAKDEDADANMSRGAAAITDNARWVMALRKLSDRAVEEFGLALPAWHYVTARRVKSNYAALGDATILTRGDGGILIPSNVVPKSELDRVMESIAGGSIEDAPAVETVEPGYEDKDLFG